MPPKSKPTRVKPRMPHSGLSGSRAGVYPNMKAAATGEDVALELVKMAKSANAPGFHTSGRVDWNQLGPWLESNAQDLQKNREGTKAFWEVEKYKWNAKTARLKYEALAGSYYGREEVLATLTRLSEAQKSMLLSKCRNELVPRLQGKSPEERLEILDRFALAVCAVYQDGISKYFKPEQI